MHEQSAAENLITLTDAAKIAPGRPSANCVWRWCRKGVLSRGGERIRLQHQRVGGMIFTTRTWLEEFGRALAEADTKYFDLCAAAVEAAREAEQPLRRRRYRSPHSDNQRRRQLERVERELDAAGL
jgi:predicted DNA-binding WGR domain protein